MKTENILCPLLIFYIHSPSLRCPPLACNVPAAWRRRGLHCRSDGRKTSKFAQTFGRATAPLAPNRPLSAGIVNYSFSLFSKNSCFIFSITFFNIVRNFSISFSLYDSSIIHLKFDIAGIKQFIESICSL